MSTSIAEGKMLNSKRAAYRLPAELCYCYTVKYLPTSLACCCVDAEERGGNGVQDPGCGARSVGGRHETAHRRAGDCCKYTVGCYMLYLHTLNCLCINLVVTTMTDVYIVWTESRIVDSGAVAR